MCSQLFPDDQRRIRTIHEYDQRQVGAAQYLDAAHLYRAQARESVDQGNPAGAASLEDRAADCEVTAGDILAGRRRP